MNDPGAHAADLAHCREAIRHGSHSFYAASKLLPAEVRDRALALYAFCRVADDAVDLQAEKAAAVQRLRTRLELVYGGTPRNSPTDRAFARMVAETEMPRALPEALIDGLAWDAEARRYRTLPELRGYAARVASAVGAMMCVLMGVRDWDALARACDLGVAMQLTNIARDIGEDAGEGRLYLPLDWMAEEGLSAEAFLADPRPGPATAAMARRLLAEADRLYHRAQAGIVTLPLACRPGIYAARYIYAGIGRHIAMAGYDSVTRRARTTRAEKIALMGLSLGAAVTDSVTPRSAVLHAAPLDETRFLVEAAATPARHSKTSSALDALVQMSARERAHRRAQRGGQRIDTARGVAT